VLVAPPTFVEAPPQAASPSPDRTFVMTVASNTLINMPLDMTRSGPCWDRMSWGEVHLLVDATGGRALTPVVYDRTGSRPLFFVQQERGTGRLIVTCAPPEGVVPRIDRAR